MLDHDPLPKFHLVVRTVHLDVVRVQGVGHVSRHQEGATAGPGEGFLGSDAARQYAGHPPHQLDHERGASALRTDRPALLVVEERHRADAALLVERAVGCGRLDEGLQREVAHAQIIQPARVDEFVAGPPQRRRLNVAELQVEIRDVLRGAAELLGDGLDNVGRAVAPQLQG